MREKTLSFVLFFVFLFLVSANYGLAENCDGTIKSENLELTVCEFNKKDKIISGKIRNNSTLEFGDVYIYFAQYNQKGVLIDTTLENVSYLGPKETWDFHITNIEDLTVRVKPVKLIERELKK